jgi:hypothetical protein
VEAGKARLPKFMTPTTAQPDGPGSGSGPGTGGPLESLIPTASSSPASSPDPGEPEGPDIDEPAEPRRKPSRAVLEKAIGKGFRAVGGVANRFLARTEAEQVYGLWLVDEDTEKDVATPAAAILARRGLGMTADGLNVVELLTALTDYVVRQLELRRDLRGAGDAPGLEGTLEEPAAA